MNEQGIEKRVKEIIAEQLGVSEKNLQAEDHLSNDLISSSMDYIEIIIALEDAYHIIIPEKDYSLINTIQETIDYISEKAGAND